MKNKNVIVGELQEEINKRLAALSGRKYEGTEFQKWCNEEINGVFKEYGIEEIRPSLWRIKIDMEENGICFFDDRVGNIKTEVKRDKRFRNSARGEVISAHVEFREDFLPLSLGEARNVLLAELCGEYIKNLEKQRADALEEARKAQEQIEKTSSARKGYVG